MQILQKQKNVKQCKKTQVAFSVMPCLLYLEGFMILETPKISKNLQFPHILQHDVLTDITQIYLHMYSVNENALRLKFRKMERFEKFYGHGQKGHKWRGFPIES